MMLTAHMSVVQAGGDLGAYFLGYGGGLHTPYAPGAVNLMIGLYPRERGAMLQSREGGYEALDQSQRRARGRTHLGAKQLVVVTTAATFPGPILSRAALIASTSVTSSSPCRSSSITTGVRLAAEMDLRHVFWSIRLQTTYRFCGCCCCCWDACACCCCWWELDVPGAVGV
jgi:hypothetical protein